MTDAKILQFPPCTGDRPAESNAGPSEPEKTQAADLDGWPKNQQFQQYFCIQEKFI